jgi:hypothetical protein
VLRIETTSNDVSFFKPRRRLEWVVTAISCLDSPGYPLRCVSWFG